MVFRFVSLSFCDVKGRERRSKPVSFSLLEKERFLESKEKGASVRVEWSQIGIRRPGFTPPLCTSPVYGRLPGWNKGKLWSYPHFFRRLRRQASERGGAIWYSFCCGAGWFDAPHIYPFRCSSQIINAATSAGLTSHKIRDFMGTLFDFTCSGHVNCPCAKVLPPAKRLYAPDGAPRFAGPLRRQPRTICLSFTRAGVPARSSGRPHPRG